MNSATCNFDNADASPSELDDAHRLSEFMLAAPSATAALQAWCTERHLGAAPISARVLDRRLLEVPSPELLDAIDGVHSGRIAARKVALCCGKLVLSIAKIWYVPDRLPESIARQLSRSTIPFGYAIAPLRPQRRTILVRIYTDMDAPEMEPHTIVEHHAVVSAGDGTVLAVVQERYQRTLLGCEHAMTLRRDCRPPLSRTSEMD